MANHLKTYTITLTTIGPIFIGSGEKIGKKESIFDMRNNAVHVPDVMKMYGWVIQHRLQTSYEKFILVPDSDFSIWLYNNHVDDSEYKKWIAYTLHTKGVDLGAKKDKEIQCFVKDAYRLPYVPGSSLKGALRTVLLADILMSQNQKYSGIAKAVEDTDKTQVNRNWFLSEEKRTMETRAFNTRNLPNTRPTDMLNDIFAGIRVSDSKPLSCDDLILCQKIDVSPQGVEKKLNVVRECIRPGTKITFDLTIDTMITNYDDKKILGAVQRFLEMYNKTFDSCFENGDDFRGNVLYLGGGSGFVSKTVLYPLLGEDAVKTVSQIIDATLPPSIRVKHKHHQDAEWGVSPHMMKKTMYQKRLVSFGPCKIEIQPK